MKELSTFTFRRYFRKTVLFLAAFLCVTATFFRGHIFLAPEGYIIMKKTPEKLTDMVTGTSYTLYEAVVNGNCMDILLREDMYLPLRINSEELGALEVAILADLRDGRKRIQDSEAFGMAEQSKYSERQINLLYKFFDYYYNENRILTIPYYGYRKTTVPALTVSKEYGERTAVYLRMFLSLGLLIFLWVKCGRIENLMQSTERKSVSAGVPGSGENISNKKLLRFKYSMFMLAVIFAVLYLSFAEIVTIL